MKWHLTLAAALALGAAALPVGGTATAADAAPSFHPRRTPVVDVVRRVRAAVVNIHSERAAAHAPEGDPTGLTPPNRVNGMGTGIVIDPRGYVLTNHHVVDDVSSLRARLGDGTSVGARVLARDSETDLALIKIDVGRPLPTIPLGTSSDVMVGETVIAIGNAYGYEHTVTVGVVSAIKRDVVLNKDVSYKQLIQTDASINPGNSGGPLLNVNGELIGVNVAIRAGAQGIGFAIPVDNMLRVAADMLSVRRRNGTWHGVVGKDEVVAPSGEVETVATRAEETRRRFLVLRLGGGVGRLLIGRARSRLGGRRLLGPCPVRRNPNQRRRQDRREISFHRRQNPLVSSGALPPRARAHPCLSPSSRIPA